MPVGMPWTIGGQIAKPTDVTLTDSDEPRQARLLNFTYPLANRVSVGRHGLKGAGSVNDMLGVDLLNRCDVALISLKNFHYLVLPQKSAPGEKTTV